MSILAHCPQCRSVLEAEPGREARCSHCGFSGVVPVGEPVSPAALVVSRSELMGPFSTLSGAVALGMFHLAQFYVPFIIAVIGIALGVAGRRKDARDLHSLVGIGLSTAAIVAGIAWVALA